MAGSRFSNPVGGYHFNASDDPLFLFNFEENSATVGFQSNLSNHNRITIIAGDIEFSGRKRSKFWRNSAYLITILAIASIAGYLLVEDLQTSTTSILKSQTVIQLEQKEASISTPEIIADVLEKSENKEVQQQPIPESTPALPIIEKKKQTAKAEKKDIQNPIIPAKPIETPKNIEEPKVVNIKPSLETGFKTKKMNQALSLAAKSGRFILVKFTAEWCMPCQMMESSVFKNQKVNNLLDSKFIILTADVDYPEGARLRSQYNIKQLPTMIILDEMGLEAARKGGGFGSAAMMNLLESVNPIINNQKEVLTTQIGDGGIGGK